ncbi:MAG: hypothetical protein ACI865_000153 [Flavobacteriaceae bacterium]|jgi:hypothetical protein
MKSNTSYLLLLYVFTFSFWGFGQEEDTIYHFDAYKNNISIGYDLRQLRKFNSSEGFGPMLIKYERSLSPNIGLVGILAFHGNKEYSELDHIVYPNGEFLRYDTKTLGFSIVPKINWHFDLSHFSNKKLKKLDLYAGLGIGYGFESSKTDYLVEYEAPSGTLELYEDKTEYYHYVATEFNVGARFFPLEHFGGYVELGFGMTRTQLGLIYKW